MKTEKHKIRPAHFNDTEAICELIKQYPQELLVRPISDIVQNIDRFLVCEHEDIICGTISWQIMPEIGAPREPSVEIKSLAVKDKYLKQGIGMELVKEALHQIGKLNPAEVIALTFTPAFFEKCGFQETSKERLLHKIYTGCINCTKYDSPLTCPEVAMSISMKT